MCVCPVPPVHSKVLGQVLGGKDDHAHYQQGLLDDWTRQVWGLVHKGVRNHGLSGKPYLFVPYLEPFPCGYIGNHLCGAVPLCKGCRRKAAGRGTGPYKRGFCSGLI